MNKSGNSKKTSSKAKTPAASTKPRKAGVKAKSISTKDKSLIIVESPTKARTLERYLAGIGDAGKKSTSAGKDAALKGKRSGSYVVVASGGHIIDLPLKRFGVDVDKGFKPEYELLPGRSRIAGIIKEAASNAREVLLATDPDREGEAIAWHITNLIKPKTKNNIWRIQFHEITKKAIQEALQSPGKVDINKVEAQQARRIMDRLVGYRVSPILWKTITGGLSAGRVQSVALRLICEREQEIQVFQSEEYWTIDGQFQPKGLDSLLARLHKLDDGKVKIVNKDESDSICDRLRGADYRVSDIRRSRKKRQPAPPYITSTLQQDAARRLNYSTKQTMSIAQRLYEGIELGNRGQVGLITYMRTDSTRVSNEAITSLRDWIASRYTPDYLCDKPRVYKNKKGSVQDAHEAIRPTDISITPDEARKYLSKQEYRLYEIIWKRFAATQMKAAEIDVTVVSVTGAGGIEFRASGQVLVYPGYLTIYEEISSDTKEDDKTLIPTGLEVGMPLDLLKLVPKQHFTQPPPRFSEAGLVKELDKMGIGRPSTYSSIISTLLDRNYVEKKEKVLQPTDLGVTVNRVLVDRFPDVFNVEFTAQMEAELDRIETGGAWLKVVEDFYIPFSESLKVAEEKRHEIKKELVTQPVGRECPECGKELVYRWGKRGKFISCSGFPGCKHSESINETPQVEVDQKCPECGSLMVIREGRYGRFLGCSTYPKCRGLLPLNTGHKCPEEGCTGTISERRSKKGRIFYGCSRYPECKFVSWYKPDAGPCPQCDAPTLFIKKSNKSDDQKMCQRCKWSEKG